MQLPSRTKVLVTHPTIEVVQQPLAREEHKVQYVPLQQRQTGQRIKDTIQKESLRLGPALKPLYASLDSAKEEIRIVRLHGGADAEPLRCTIHHTSLLSKTRLKYESISYRWGKEYTTVEIDRVNARVPTSAARVLHRMRHSRKDRLLWIDAICINQGDDEEKGFQVALMGKIYQKSSRNLIWLGDANVDPSKLQKTLDVVLKDAYYGAKDFDLEMMVVAASATRDATRLDTKIDLTPLTELFDSEWFHRLWIVQEAALAPSNVCCLGSATVEFSKVLKAAAWLEFNKGIVPDQLKTSGGLSQAATLWYLMKSISEDNLNLFAVFNLLKHFRATEPRDRIYGILGLFQEQDPSLQIRQRLLHPDYEKPKEQVFRDATRAMIEDSGALEVLHYVDHHHRTFGTPSWVVEFDRTCQRDCAPVCQSSPFNACADLAFAPIPLSDRNILACAGYAVDVVVGDPIRIPGRDGLRDGSLARFLRTVKDLIKSRTAIFGSNWARGVALTLTAGIDLKHQAAGAAHVDDFLTFMKYIESGQHCPLESRDGKYLDRDNLQASRWFHSFEKATGDRCLFVTENGLIGLGPVKTKGNDHVAILFGGRVPYVLSYKRGYEFIFVGECYAHGLMYGTQMSRYKGHRPDTFFLV